MNNEPQIPGASQASGQFKLTQVEMAASKVIFPGPRSCIIACVVIGGEALFLGGQLLAHGDLKATFFVVGFCAAVAAFLCKIYSSLSIFIGDGFIGLKKLGESAYAIRFSELSKSVDVKARGHRRLHIFTHGCEEPALVIPLGMLRKSDAVWLLALPELKIERR